MNTPSGSSSESRHCPVPLDTPDMLRFVDPHLSVRFQHHVADAMEAEVLFMHSVHFAVVSNW